MSSFSSESIVIRGQLPTRRLSDYKLIALDMDSTLINIECIDEIADACGRKAQVAEITEATMRGEITDFQESLRRRLAMLQGVSIVHLHGILKNRLQLNPGAKNLVASCKRTGLKVLLLSGGFTFFARHVKDLLEIDFMRANELEIIDGHLTGQLISQSWGTICDGEQKRHALLNMASFMGISPSQCIAVGDGANDIPMMEASGLSVAFHAKPTVQERAIISIIQGGLDQLLSVLTY